MAPTGISSLRLYGLPISRSSRPSSSSSILAPPLTTSIAPCDTASATEQCFTLPPASMPPPGPEYYEARRALWLTAPPSIPCQPYPPSPSTSRAKLEVLLNQESKADDDSVWNSGLRSVWKGLVGGGRLRRRLPLAMVVRDLFVCVVLQITSCRHGTADKDIEGGMAA